MHKDNSRGVHHVALSYSLSPTASGGDLVIHPLMEMLDAVERRGSISAAARTLGLSYRHVWGELKRWEESFGRLLIVWEKGQKARLTSFGQKLLWAERQAQSRLAPQIAALRGDLERAFGMAFDDEAHVLPAIASHDDALAAFRQRAQSSGVYLDLRFSGSIDALSAMSDGRVCVSGFHLPAKDGGLDLSIREALAPQLQEALGTTRAKAVPFARRQQGLMVEPGNPLKIRSIQDLLGGRHRFVNRGPGAGTRLILDALLSHHRASREAIKGYRHEEPSHAAVAESVRTGQADVGLGLASVAHARGLGFVPLFEEEYWLAFRTDGINEPAIHALVAELASPAWRAQLSTLVGYQPMPLSEACPVAVALA